ncbi:precorrin-3B synthase, partial [Mesorhizobium sp. M1A.F.Ca.IN.020.03.1.1]
MELSTGWSSTAPPSVLPDISPTRGEIRYHAGFRQSSTLQEGAGRQSCQSPPLWG